MEDIYLVCWFLPSSYLEDLDRFCQVSTRLFYDHPQQCGRPEFDPRVKKIPCRREWLPTPIILPGESHGQRSLATTGHGFTESDMTQRQHFIPYVTLSPEKTKQLLHIIPFF